MVNNIVFEQVGYTYNANSPFEYRALYDINLEIPAGKITAIVGHTGSGKSTLLQHLNVLVRPTTGAVTIAGEKVTATSKHESLKPLRKKVGVVFQFPEAQLFEETVLKDVMFGPLNFGATEEEAERIAREKLALVGISESLYNRSPFDLSGGQMRRVAIAGVLALEPEILVLDEPTAGLDPMGHVQMLEMFVNLQKSQNLTMVMVTHHMEDVVSYAEHVIVMNQGTKLTEGSPEALFQDDEWLNDYQLGLPNTLHFMKRLEERLGIAHTHYPLSVEALINDIIALKDEEGTDVR
ncbi:energy-coupling factor ABC transporter ATP-binding protein [Aerococcaceae bacterium zg-B36]|uniref:energy-coupling factor ABC transporter ATP-binding protein n=1 Tax=Aerococcaceae bacterium zg-252 TaxID=2796928 RepID=UPI001BD9052B|nr:energy-coupling factor ABC transporter ATP-binding protein [Aerococcaceae bacterium zg-B36]